MKHVVAGGVAALLLVGCSRSTPPPVVTTTVVTTVVSSPAKPTPTPTFRPAPASYVQVLPGDGSLPAGQVAGDCPYLDTQTAMDIEGNRVGQTALSAAKPTACTFYYAYAPVRATLQIAPMRFTTATDAYNAMVLTGEAGSEIDSRRGIVSGVDAVLYRTKFYQPDGGRNWACSFAKGTTMVTVRTDRTDTSYNALQLAKAIAGKF
jgi:hypothetical protein